MQGLFRCSVLYGKLELVGAKPLHLATQDVYKRQLESRDRSRAGPTLPAKGLFLKCVEYDL